MLVSDPSIEKSAAALSVAVGSLQEPKEFGGLAHYLEHMLFLGTTRYPTVGDYSEFISRNGGSQNAYTQLDHTNYMVAVNNDAYDEALSRFSGFFYEATLDQRYADKERNAVHSEWTMKSPNDWVILEQLNGSTLNPEHPISQFNWGNLDSLVDKKDNKLQAALVDMYNTYYSANLMKGAMISNLPIADMKKLAKQHFGKIPNKNTPRPKMTVAVAKPEHLKKVVHYIPQTDMKQLRINFVIENNIVRFVAIGSHSELYG
jgi:protease-3